MKIKDITNTETDYICSIIDNCRNPEHVQVCSQWISRITYRMNKIQIMVVNQSLLKKIKSLSFRDLNGLKYKV
jgi:hypothetical protein